MDELQAAILAYKPSQEVKDLLKTIPALLLVGPTGSGKNTLENELIKTSHFKRIVTHTTRRPRINHGQLEKEGEEYHFISDKTALKMLKDQAFIEAAYTHGHLYATSIDEFITAKQQNKVAVADIDIKGVRSYRQLSPLITAIFLLPPSFNILLERLKSRYGQTSNEEDIRVRLTTALTELNELLEMDYYYAIINERISKTTQRVLEIIDSKEEPQPNQRAIKLANKLISDIKNYLAN